MTVDHCLGIDIGGTSIKSGLVDEAGQLIGAVMSTPVGIDPLETVLAVAQERSGACRAIGVGSPGYLDVNRTMVEFSVNLGWRQVEVPRLIAVATEHTVVMEGDANAAALAESRVGAGIGYASCLVVTLGTGIGVGFTIDDHVFLGAHGFAGQAGHMPVLGGDQACECGRTGCWEIDASTRGFERMVEQTELRGLGAREILRQSASGDTTARRAVEAWTDRICAGLIPLMCMLDPGCVVIAGAASESHEAFLPHLRSRVAGAAAGQTIPILPAQLGSAAGVIGAGLLAWDHLRTRDIR